MQILFQLEENFSKDRKYYFSESRQRAENFNLGPLKDLDSLIDEVLGLDSVKSYLRNQVAIGRAVTGDLKRVQT